MAFREGRPVFLNGITPATFLKAQVALSLFYIMPYYVYILQSLKDGSYYIGSTQDLDSRLERHNQGRTKYTKAKRPWKLVYHEEYPDRSSAVKRENQIKNRKSTSYIENLISTYNQS